MAKPSGRRSPGPAGALGSGHVLSSGPLGDPLTEAESSAKVTYTKRAGFHDRQQQRGLQADRRPDQFLCITKLHQLGSRNLVGYVRVPEQQDCDADGSDGNRRRSKDVHRFRERGGSGREHDVPHSD